LPLLLLILAAVAAWWFFHNTAATSAGGATGVSNMNASSADPNALNTMAQAIFNFEGGGKPGATNSWNNNPGNIGGGQATYSSAADGWNALMNYITGHATEHPDWTFQQFFSYYLTGNPNNSQVTNQGDPVSYANYVANYMGTSPDQTVSSALGL
jgi:hypothetical protein